MSTVAINTALTASSVANNSAAQAAAHRAKVDRCVVFESTFDAGKASVAEKQEYSSCVEVLYPQPVGESAVLLLKGSVLLVLLALVIGAVLGYRERDGLFPIVANAFMGAAIVFFTLVVLFLIYCGIAFLFS